MGDTSRRAALYARVSSAEQVEGHSLDFQLQDMKLAAQRDGFEVAAEYRDEGFSAKTDKRPEFQRMIADAKAGRFVRIYVWKFDRFARNREDSAIYKGLLRRSGVQVVSVKEPTDGESPASVMLEGMLEVVAEWYSADLRQKMTRAKRQRADLGLYNGDIPFGYRKSCGHHRCTVKNCAAGAPVPVAEEAAAVRSMYEQYATGQASFRDIADAVNAKGFRTRNKRKSNIFGLVGPRPFTDDSVRDIVTNPFYKGVVAYRGEVRPGQHEAIVALELWESCQRVRKNHTKRARTWQKSFRWYLLKGLARCADCGERLHSTTTRSRAYYRCAGAQRGVGCHGRSVGATVIDEQVDALMRGLALPPAWQRHVLAAWGKLDERMKEARERDRAKAKLERLGKAYVDGTVTESEYLRMKRELEAQVAAYVEPVERDVFAAGRLLERMADLWNKMTVEEKSGVLGEMFEAVVVDLREQRVLGPAPKPAFRALLRVCDGSVRPVSGDEGGDSKCASGDPEGIRTLDLHRDRVAC